MSRTPHRIWPLTNEKMPEMTKMTAMIQRMNAMVGAPFPPR